MPWVAVWSSNALPADGAVKFPKLALRAAWDHRLVDDALATTVGGYWRYEFSGRDPWDKVRVQYTCVHQIDGQGDSVVFDKTFWSMDWRVQWLHVHNSESRGSARFSNTEFALFPP